MHKISICTVCMNRLAYLSQTLPVNIAQNLDYPNLEFVVLNYNSKDDMDNWMRTHMSSHIESGLIKYYRTDEPEFFNVAHSKNMVSKLATGDIICNIDADNYAGPGYAHWVNESFSAWGPDIVITTIRKDAIPHRDQGGKLCFTKDLFNRINGYDESLIGYGMDDVELSNRLENAGAKRVYIEEEKYLQYIPHSDQLRNENYHYPNNLRSIYACISDNRKDRQKVLYIFIDGSAEELDYQFNESLLPNPIATFAGWTIDQQGHKKATIKESGDRLTLMFLDGSVGVYEMKNGMLYPAGTPAGSAWKKMSEADNNYRRILTGYNECLNRRKLVYNSRPDTTVNVHGWGRGNVFLNFDSKDARPVC